MIVPSAKYYHDAELNPELECSTDSKIGVGMRWLLRAPTRFCDYGSKGARSCVLSGFSCNSRLSLVVPASFRKLIRALRLSPRR